MSRVLVATLLLSPVLLSAQAKLPAQTLSSAVPVLQSKLIAPAMMSAEAAKDAASVTPGRVSTGVVAPKLIHTVAVESAASSDWVFAHVNRTVVVGLTVDEAGKPEDLKILESAGTATDRNVLEAVSQYRFTPGTVSHQAMAIPMRLEVILEPSR